MHDQSIPARKKHQVETGQKFGRWAVIGTSDRLNVNGEHAYVACRCECGVEREVQRSSLTSGKSQSCGCLHRERVTRHARVGTSIYQLWANMVYRCGTPTAPNFHLYGGRGINVCPRWLDSVEAFIEDMGPRPDGTTLDRIDTNGDYEPGNCRWASATEQNRNKRDNHRIEHAGRSLVLSEWAVVTGIPRNTIFYRLQRGWSAERALTTPRVRCFHRTHNKEVK